MNKKKKNSACARVVSLPDFILLSHRGDRCDNFSVSNVFSVGMWTARSSFQISHYWVTGVTNMMIFIVCVNSQKRITPITYSSNGASAAKKPHKDDRQLYSPPSGKFSEKAGPFSECCVCFYILFIIFLSAFCWSDNTQLLKLYQTFQVFSLLTSIKSFYVSSHLVTSLSAHIVLCESVVCQCVLSRFCYCSMSGVSL